MSTTGRVPPTRTTGAATSNASRAQYGRHAYYPFGQESTSQSQNTEERKFTSHERDTNFVNNDRAYLDYMHARYYSPVMGRFLSVDPVLGRPRVPQSWNRYAYSFNSPIQYYDPDGRDPRYMVPPDLPRDVPPVKIGRYTYHFDATHGDIDITGGDIQGKTRLRSSDFSQWKGKTPKQAIRNLEKAIRKGDLPDQAFRYLEKAGNTYLKELADQGAYRFGLRALGPIAVGIGILFDAEPVNADDTHLLDEAVGRTPSCSDAVSTNCISTGNWKLHWEPQTNDTTGRQ